MATAVTTGQMVQLNLRVNGQDKLQAEEVLHMMGTTTTQLVRQVLAKVARGAKDYAEVMEALEESPVPQEKVDEQENASINPVLVEGWAIGERFMQSLGYERMADVPRDDRSWDEMYEEAMADRVREKGWIS